MTEAAPISPDTPPAASARGSLPRRGKGSRLRYVALTTLTAGALAAVWELLSVLDLDFWPEIILSKPSEIIPAFFRALTTGFVWQNFWVTAQEALIGFVLGAGSAFVLGVLIALVATFRQAVYPILVGFQATPRVALAPVFVAWFGFGITSKVALAATICFFPVLINTITGLTFASENSVLLMRSLKASRFQIFAKLRLPASLPTVFAGVKAALTFAVIGAIVGELTAANEGAGHLIETAAFQFRMEDVFAYVIMLGIFGLFLFLFSSAIERRLIFWHKDTTHRD
jgi:NitT/TauT family transport system permease protein